MKNTRNTNQEPPPPPPSPGVFEIPGESAILINGLPDEPQTDPMITTDYEPASSSSNPTTGCGEWVVGREVRKQFSGQYYSGTVTKFEKETGWYRVEYEDGDFEDLDWSELEEIILPLDVKVPLTSIALGIIESREPQTQTRGRRRKRKNGNT